VRIQNKVSRRAVQRSQLLLTCPAELCSSLSLSRSLPQTCTEESGAPKFNYSSNSKLYYSHWKTLGVSEWMWSVNLDASMSGDYQTLGGHSCQHSELLGAPTTSLGAPVKSLRAPRITVQQSGKNNISFGNAAGAPGNHWNYLSFYNFYNSCFMQWDVRLPPAA